MLSGLETSENKVTLDTNMKHIVVGFSFFLSVVSLLLLDFLLSVRFVRGDGAVREVNAGSTFFLLGQKQ